MKKIGEKIKTSLWQTVRFLRGNFYQLWWKISRKTKPALDSVQKAVLVEKQKLKRYLKAEERF